MQLAKENRAESVGSHIIATTLKYLILIAASFITLLPILVILLGSLKTGPEFNSTGPFALPAQPFYFKNYITAFTKGKMLLGFANTSILLLFSCLGTVFTGTMTAYVLHRYEFKFKKLVRLMFLWISLIPSVTAQVATFQIVQRLGLYNTMGGGVVLMMGTGHYLRVYFPAVPRQRAEIDRRIGDHRRGELPHGVFPDRSAAFAPGDGNGTHHKGNRDLQ